MPTYAELKENRRQFLATTSLTVTEFDQLVAVFRDVYQARYPTTVTQAGQPRQRRVGGGRQSRLATLEDKRVFILMYQKTYPLQTVQGLAFGLSQSRTNELIHDLMPVLEEALTQMGYRPERDPAAFPTSGATPGTPPALLLDGTERRRQRPKNPEKQRENYRGKKSPHR
jgi:hypothetical protein